MEKNITKVLPRKSATESSGTSSGGGGGGIHAEGFCSSVSAEKLGNCEQNVSLDLGTEGGIGEPVGGKSGVKKLVEVDVVEKEEDDFVLRLQSSDEETFEDAIEEVAEVKKTAAEKYFSDIESSDDSQVYEPKSTPIKAAAVKAGDLVLDLVEPPAKVRPHEESKPIEPEFEPVESDEEDFEESLLFEGDPTVTPSKEEELSELDPMCEVENASNEAEEEEVPASKTSLIYEESTSATNEPVVEDNESSPVSTTALIYEESSSATNEPVVEDNESSVVSTTPVIYEESFSATNDPVVEDIESTSREAGVYELNKSSEGSPATDGVVEDDDKEEDVALTPFEEDAGGADEAGETIVVNSVGDDATQEVAEEDAQTTTAVTKEKTEIDDQVSVADGSEIVGRSIKSTKAAEDDIDDLETSSSTTLTGNECLTSKDVTYVQQAIEVDTQVETNPMKRTDEDESNIPAKNKIDVEEAMEVDTECETNPKKKESTPKIFEVAEQTLDKMLQSEESLHTDEEKSSEEVTLHETKVVSLTTADKSQILSEISEDVMTATENEKLVDKSKQSEEKLQKPEEPSKILTENKESQEETGYLEKHPVGNNESPKEADTSLNLAVKFLTTTEDPFKECLENLTDTDNLLKTADASVKRTMSLSDASKALESSEKSKDSVVNPIEAEASQKNSSGEQILAEKLKKTDKSTEDVTEEKTSPEIVEESKESVKDTTEVEIAKEKVITDGENSKEGMKDEKSQETAEKLLENSKESADNEQSKPTESGRKSVEKIIDSSIRETSKREEVSDGAETGEAMKKKIEDKSACAGAEDNTSIDKAEHNSRVENKTREPITTKSNEPDVIEICDDDDDDVNDNDGNNKQVDAVNDIGKVEETKSSEENATETKKADSAAEVIEEGADTSNNANQCKEDTLQPGKEKDDVKQVPAVEVKVMPVKKPSEKPDSVPEYKKVEAKQIDKSEVGADKDDDVEMLEIIETSDNEDALAADNKPKEEQTTKDDTTMKPPENYSVQRLHDDDDEPLLMIDSAHQEENDNEDNDMDTETEQTATSAPSTDSSSDGSLEIFHDKDCVSYECKHGSKNFYRATLFSLNYYRISKKRNKVQFVCEECYDRALDAYEEMCRTLKQKQPLLLGTTFKGQEYVEIIDSSDEEESDSAAEKFKDENVLPKESIQLLEAELEGAIRKVMHNVEIQNQLSWTKQILQQRLNSLEEDTEFVSEQLRLLQKKTDNMHNSLYQCPKIKIRQLTPLDLNSGRSYNPETESTIPPIGEVIRANIHLNETYYAVKNKAIASWVPCKVVEAIDGYLPHSKNSKYYKIKFVKSKYPMLKTVAAKHMAYFNSPKVRLPIGTRVIAYFDASSLSRGKEKMQIPSAFYPGIIAEPLKQTNNFRYLVFYDDGYFQYVYHKDVRLVCQASEQVWEDVHHQSREFIHNYLTQYAVNRPMVQTQKGQSMLVDYNGKWIYARVIDVDCSLVQMLYEGQSRSEWIYRGSTRLGPVYKESNNLVQKNQWGTSRRRTEPFIRYFNGDDSTTSTQQPQECQQQSKSSEPRSVAKKSVSRVDTPQSSQPVAIVRHLNNSTIFVDDDNKPKGKVVYYTARKNLPPRDYVTHICGPSCPFTITHNLLYYSPLAKPLLSGWERQVFRQKSKKFIVYRGPCGKRMRSMEELHRYLRVTENELNVDNFDFSPETNCLAEYVIESCIVQKKDISNGKEKMPIPCVNYYDHTMPPNCVYSSRRIPTEGVPLNLDREFLVGCDCEDDCSDKTKCSCWELTYAGAKYGMPNVPNEMVGYQYKRLYEHVPTGIYECNSRCKCKANCVNRVVQQPLQSKLQVFKTSNRGWGLRCINDVPRGSFICVYAGHLLTEQKANEGGLDAGDEYFAELDYIEVAEQIKEGYESDVVEPDEDEELYNPEKEDDDDEFVAPSESHHNKAFSTRLRTRRSTKSSNDAEHDSQERQVISFEPNRTMGQPGNSTSEKPTIRKLFGKDEACYIMDAKITGNLGRYFNHSCSPNLFVQNVFVDTHDLRFPWVAFFAFTHIRAGTELTWNYNYEVGVVPGKVLYCQCGAPNCRQRLL